MKSIVEESTTRKPLSVISLSTVLLTGASLIGCNYVAQVVAFSVGPRTFPRPTFLAQQGGYRPAAKVPPLLGKVSSTIPPAVDNVNKREELKRDLLEAADKFKAIQASAARTEIEANKGDTDGEDDIAADPVLKDRRYTFRLVRKIMSKIMRRKKNKSKKTVLRSDAFGTAKLEVGEAGNAAIEIAEELAKLNPTSNPTYGWKGYGGGSPSDCKLTGRWKLRFTTAADATFSESAKRGKILTSQEVDAERGTLTNVVDFERGKLKGFRVVVAGNATSDNEIDLTFRRVVILRNSRLFKKLIFPIPTRLLRALNRYLSKGKSNPRGPYFQLQYLDDNLRMHKTGEGNWFIQSRLE